MVEIKTIFLNIFISNNTTLNKMQNSFLQGVGVLSYLHTNLPNCRHNYVYVVPLFASHPYPLHNITVK